MYILTCFSTEYAVYSPLLLSCVTLIYLFEVRVEPFTVPLLDIDNIVAPVNRLCPTCI